ncbi:MAG: helix-turn-helix domain-containing protein [Acidobacteria bacterium]|nr:helix-turn-helix domain-containing protein [Acidobacteriota bacterium]
MRRRLISNVCQKICLQVEGQDLSILYCAICLFHDENCQNPFSTVIGITYPTLHKITNGKVEAISFKVLEKLCDNLKCTPNNLLNIEK